MTESGRLRRSKVCLRPPPARGACRADTSPSRVLDHEILVCAQAPAYVRRVMAGCWGLAAPLWFRLGHPGRQGFFPPVYASAQTRRAIALTLSAWASAHPSAIKKISLM